MASCERGRRAVKGEKFLTRRSSLASTCPSAGKLGDPLFLIRASSLKNPMRKPLEPVPGSLSSLAEIQLGSSSEQRSFRFSGMHLCGGVVEGGAQTRRGKAPRRPRARSAGKRPASRAAKVRRTR